MKKIVFLCEAGTLRPDFVKERVNDLRGQHRISGKVLAYQGVRYNDPKNLMAECDSNTVIACITPLGGADYRYRMESCLYQELEDTLKEAAERHESAYAALIAAFKQQSKA